MAEPSIQARRGGLDRPWIRLVLGLALSGAAMWLALRGIHLSEIADAIGNADWRWLPAMLAIKAATLVIKDLRWRCELGAMAPGPYRATFRAIGLGYFGNIVLPFKLGEILRVGLLRRYNPGVRVGEALATIAAERALDGAILAIMVGAVLNASDPPGWVLLGTIILLAVMLGVIGLAMLPSVHRFFLDRLPDRGLFGVARKVIAALTRGTAVLRNPRAFATASLLTAVAWLAEAVVFYCAVRALGVSLGFTSTLVVTLLLSVGLLIPSAPGQIGTHQALCLLFLAPFGVDKLQALSISFVLQGVALTVLCSIGGFVMIREAGARELLRGAPGAETSAVD